MTPNLKPLRSVEEAHSELEREFNVRMRCYDNWVKDGKMSRIDAQDRLDRLAAALNYLTGLLPKQESQVPTPAS